MASGHWHKKTITDLYIERDGESWYFKALAILTACLILLGYLIFGHAFPSATPTDSTLTIVAAVFLALGYSLSVALGVICRSWLFQLEVLFMPCLAACILGTINSGLAIAITSQPWVASSIAAIALGISSSVTYAVLAYLIYCRVQRVRNPNRQSARKRESSEALTLLPEEELQRQNLERLLASKSIDRSPQQTYRINIPDSTVALKTPPPLTAPIQGLGLSGTLGGTPYDSHNPSLSASLGASSFDDQYGTRGRVVSEPPISSQRAALEAAREKARIAQARANPPSPRNEEDSLPWPPVIVNTRNQYEDDIGEIPLSERHPLERTLHIPGRASKDKDEIYSGQGVHRSDEDFGGYDYEEARSERYSDEPTFEIVEGANIRVDLSKDYMRQQPANLRPPNPSYSPSAPRRESHRRSPDSR